MYYVLDNGEKVRLTITYRGLNDLREKAPAAYGRYKDTYRRIGENKDIDLIFDPINIIYTAYLCGLDEIGNAVPYDEFLDLIQQDIAYNTQIMGALIQPKKKEASALPS